MTEKPTRWYPSSGQLKDPQSTERAFREVLRMLYELTDRHEDLSTKFSATLTDKKPTNG